MSPERFAKMQKILSQRQPDLTVCMEQVHKRHNFSAIARTADAVGCHDVHAVWPEDRRSLGGGTAGGSQNWLNIHMYDHIDQAFDQFKSQGMQVLATHLAADSVDFREIDYTKPTCVLMGTERDGITEYALSKADHNIVVPMMGMVQSLNVSVACSLILYEAQRQRQNANMYGPRKISDEEYHRIIFENGHPVYAKHCKRKGLAYPELDEQGQIVAPDDWWDALRKAD
ncbi:tRNA (guanosine(18)-2'-O)-methyltransferase TrmH [Catenovulum sp. SM1970]|uniref:tRNA (guanosine(18)-2'-O)-methyltransferase TrmH n=1 Tax=Marinifaba aquimaris TaxID=2741323 RepID=UPI001574E1EC|nr:tRNA (guanosine(18)-2'-O)-methyltransferase TrmH [Marinifaba aquimaris]NTS75946.1 tRNA (guanosine(18)-2'-O)-methyltransferase TrmH [Marinifaba aquimaris]